MTDKQFEQEPVAEIVRYENLVHRTCWDIKVHDKSLKHGTKLYAEPVENSVLTKIIEARKNMMRRKTELLELARSGTATIYDAELEKCRALIFKLIDAQIECLATKSED